jgi:DNA polymerase-3 subunit beta
MMHFEIEKKEFLRGLNLIQSVSGRKTTLPILSHVLMEWENNRLCLTGTDLETAIREELEIRTSESGKASISAKKLYEVVRELPERTIQIEKKENHWIKLQCGKSIFNIAGLDPEEFPALPSYTSDQFNPIPTRMLLDMIEKTIYAAASDETRRYLNGIFWIQKEVGDQKRIQMVASDGHRLSLVEKEGPTVTGMEKGVILPRKGVLELRRMMAEKGGEEKVGVFVDPLYVFFEVGKSLIVIRRVDGEFPEYEQVIPSDNDKKVVVGRESFYGSLRRVSTMASERVEGVKLFVEKDRMEVFSYNQDFGDAKEDLEVTYGGNPFEIGFNARYLMDALTVIDQDEVVMEIKDDGSPGLLRPVLPDEKSTHISIIMPMKI